MTNVPGTISHLGSSVQPIAPHCVLYLVNRRSNQNEPSLLGAVQLVGGWVGKKGGRTAWWWTGKGAFIKRVLPCPLEGWQFLVFPEISIKSKNVLFPFSLFLILLSIVFLPLNVWDRNLLRQVWKFLVLSGAPKSYSLVGEETGSARAPYSGWKLSP